MWAVQLLDATAQPPLWAAPARLQLCLQRSQSQASAARDAEMQIRTVQRRVQTMKNRRAESESLARPDQHILQREVRCS